MVAATRNESAERLRIALHNEDLDYIRPVAEEALTTERRATAKRIEERLLGTMPLSASNLLPWLFAAIDEEAAR